MVRREAERGQASESKKRELNAEKVLQRRIARKTERETKMVLSVPPRRPLVECWPRSRKLQICFEGEKRDVCLNKVVQVYF